jgi:3-carboxy-cis,cis-muconate cycloisomerase
MMRLTRQMGRHEAHRLLYEAAQRTHADGTPFMESIQAVAGAMGLQLPDDLHMALKPGGYLGESATIAQDIVERVLSLR